MDENLFPIKSQKTDINEFIKTDISKFKQIHTGIKKNLNLIMDMLENGHEKEKIIKELIWLSERQKSEQKVFKESLSRVSNIDKKSRVQALYISTGDNCTRKCFHCFYGNNTETTIEKTYLESIINQAKDNGVFTIIFGGKEPLMDADWNLIAPIIKANQDIFFKFHTNLDNLNQNKIDDIQVNNNCVIEFSFDGDSQDIKKWNGSSEKVWEWIELLKKNNIPFGGFITVTKEDNFANILKNCQNIILQWATSLHIVWYKPIWPKNDIDKILTPEQEMKRYLLKLYLKEKYPYISLPLDGCNPSVGSQGEFSYCPFLAINDSNIKLESKAFPETMQEHKKHFWELLENNIKCPLIENPKWIIDYTTKYLKKDSLRSDKIKNMLIENAKKYAFYQECFNDIMSSNKNKCFQSVEEKYNFIRGELEKKIKS